MAYLGSSESKHYQGVYSIRKAYLGATQVIDDTVNGLLDFYGGANAAYSLRSLSAAWSSQDVVEVRRASDDSTSGFTSTEVSDGTLTNWVNATVALPLDMTAAIPVSNATFINNAFETFTGASASGFYANNTSVSGFATSVLPSGAAGDKIRVTFDIVVTSGSPALALRSTTGSGSVESNVLLLLPADSGSHDIEFTATGAYGYLGFSEGDSPSEFTVSNLTVTNVTGAAAAYSLRDLSVSRADLTSSGDTGGETTGALVAQVRRSSDDEIKSFTAAEVAGGSLETWVNTVGAGARNRTGSAKWVSFAQTATGFDAATTTASACGYDLYGNSGDSITVTFDVVVNSGSCSVMLRDVFETGGVTVSNSEAFSTSGTKSFTFTATADFVAFQFITGAADIEVSNFSIDVPWTNSGHVTKWYDQSGNDNHAVQITEASQPKIVDAGTLVAGLKFDGADVLNTSLVPPSVATFATVASVASTGVTQMIVGARDSTNERSYLSVSSAANLTLGAASGATSGGSISSGSGFVAFGMHNVTERLVSLNGAEVSESGIAPNNTVQGYSIGAWNDAGSDSLFLSGTISELIIYNSDQSGNRKAIESNMADYHTIDLDASVDHDSGFDQVDGFVATWYDQSGNGNNAVQITEASQPKIVENGNLLKDSNNNPEIKFKDSYLKTTQGYAVELSQNNSSVFAVTDAIVSKYLITEADATSSYSSNFIFGDNDGNSSLWVNSSEFGSSYPLVQALTGFIYDGTNFQAYINGEASGSSGTATVNTEVNGATFIGSQATDATTEFYEGSIQEIIIYDSDQSDVRLGIEKEINNVYDIY